MSRPGLRGLAAMIVIGWVVLTAPSARAAIEGPCTATFNGVEVGRVDSTSSPLELGDQATLVFQGVDDDGTRRAEVEVVLIMITLDRGVTTHGTIRSGFRAELDLGSLSPSAVGLFRIRGTTDNCVAEGWLRVSGRFPATTLIGITAAGIAVGGVAAQSAAILSRRRWAPLYAALGGVVTGLGGAMIGQSFGRLQISLVSLGIGVVIASALGGAVAWLLAPRAAPRTPEPEPEPKPEWAYHDEPAHTLIQEPAAAASPTWGRRGEAPGDSAEPEPGAETSGPSGEGGRYWCYVMGATEVLDLDAHDRIVGRLVPGTWYLAKTEASGWVHVVVSKGVEGWVPQDAVHRQG